MDNFSDRSLLKNLGHWLGMITLAKNKPIVLDDINLKMLLVEAYNKGHQELLFTVPFIAKVLESCAKSRVCIKCTLIYYIEVSHIKKWFYMSYFVLSYTYNLTYTFLWLYCIKSIQLDN